MSRFIKQEDMATATPMGSSKKPAGQTKRSRADDDDDSDTKSPLSPRPNKVARPIRSSDQRCGNCGDRAHRAAVCVKTRGSGWMEACCKCDSRKHTYENCPSREPSEDFIHLILNRGNKPPVKCSLHLGRVVLLELTRPGTPFKDDQIVALPWSSSFSRQRSRFLLANADPDVEPERHQQPLGRAVRILRDQRWTVEDGEIDACDGKCENCGSNNHSVYQCASMCGFCGSWDHHTVFCEHKSEACLCDKYPRHTIGRCDPFCWYWDDSGSQPVLPPPEPVTTALNRVMKPRNVKQSRNWIIGNAHNAQKRPITIQFSIRYVSDTIASRNRTSRRHARTIASIAAGISVMMRPFRC